MSTLLSDLRFAFRGLRRSPLFSIVAILSLALGIGANSAIFTLIDQVLLRKLPVTRPDELVMLYQQGSHNGSNMGTRMHSYPIYQDYQQKAAPLAEVLCRRLVPASVSVDNRTERLQAELVSGNYFTMLGVAPAVGVCSIRRKTIRSTTATQSLCSATTTGSVASPVIPPWSAERFSSTTRR